VTTPFKEIRVDSWEQLMSVLHSKSIVTATSDAGNHRRSPYLFRGMDNAEWTFQTSLQRLSKEPSADCKLIERSLIRSFRKYASAGSFDEKSEWYVLAVAQHNGLPTRCLDWTVSPLVATHFACSDESQKSNDGAIWCLHAGRLREINIANNTKQKSLKGIAWVYDTRLLERDFVDIQRLDDSKAESLMMLLWEPPSLDSRIANQWGLLSLMNDCESSQHDFLMYYAAKHPDLLMKIILDASMKSEARDMLDQNNVSERTLFPGLPSLCSWLKRHYGTAW